MNFINDQPKLVVNKIGQCFKWQVFEDKAMVLFGTRFQSPQAPMLLSLYPCQFFSLRHITGWLPIIMTITGSRLLET